MSFNDIEPESDGDESTETDEQTGVADLEARIRDLEVEVYGYDARENTAGRQAVVDVKRTILFLDNRRDEDDDDLRGVPMEDIHRVAGVIGLNNGVVEQAYEKLKRRGEVYEPADEEVRPI